MSSTSAADTEQDKKKGAGVIMSPSTFDHDTVATPPPPAPPPPLPMVNIQRRRRIRSFYWKPIPEERVQQRGGPNLWTLAKHSDKHKFQIDIKSVEDLFGLNDRHTVAKASNKTSRVHSGLSEQNKEVSILDPKRSMNVAIFLKCFKKSIQSLIDDIAHGKSEVFGAERLRELNKLLPDTHEVEKLHSYKGDKTNLNTVDSFMYQLTLLPRFDLRVEAMLLKEEFSALCSSLKQDVSIIRSAIQELLSCVELHSVLHLVLEAGNIINTDGYGGNAVGFKLSSLLSLAETKSNKPGMNLLHFVALEAKKKDDQLLKFPEKLQCVESAARVSVDSLNVELDNLNLRLETLQQNIQNDSQLLQQLHTFLQCAAVSLKEVSACHSLLMTEGEQMIEFFCEDTETFKLDECFYIFSHFCSKFTKAVQENEERAMRAASQLKRLKSGRGKQPSWAGQHWPGSVLGSRCSSEIDVRTAVKWEGLIDLLIAQPPSFHSSLGEYGLHRRRHRFSDSNMNITPTDTHSPSDTQSHPVSTPVQLETHTLFPELQNLPFKTLSLGHHGNEATEMSSSDETNNEEFLYNDTGIKHPDQNRHMEMTTAPAKARVEDDAKLESEVRLGVESELGLGVESDVGLGVVSEVGLGLESELGLEVESSVGLVVESEVGLGVISEVELGVESDVGLGVESKVGLGEESEVELEVISEVGLGVESEMRLGVTSEVGLGVESEVGLGAKSEVDKPTDLMNKDYKTEKLIFSPADDKTNAPELKTTSKSTNQESDRKTNKITNRSNKTPCKSVQSFRKTPVKKSIVSPDPSPSSSSLKPRPINPVQTPTQTDRQSMRKIISVSSTKPRSITHSPSVKIPAPTTSASSRTTAPVHTSPTPKASLIQKSMVKKPIIQQKSAPKEKPCRFTPLPTQESHTNTKTKTLPHFASNTVSYTTRSSVTTSNVPLSQKDVSITPKNSPPRRASHVSMPSRSASKDSKNVKVSPVRPAWR